MESEPLEIPEWKEDQRIDQILTRMSLAPDADFQQLSSGMKRRVLLARVLVRSPDVLLLDEPTNHLDIPAIRWLEDYLSAWRGTLIFVTHDRMFLRRLANRILEIDRGRLFDWMCDYDTFLNRKEAELAAQEKQDALFDKKLAQEEVWIRQGIKARRTRNEGRVRALEEMRRQRSQRQGKVGEVRLKIDEGQRSGQLVAELKDVTFHYPECPIVERLTTSIMRGDKMGIIGPNGIGKTTLLKLILGQLKPQSGTVRNGTNLQVAYFDQLRDQLDPEKTVQENVGDGYDTIEVGGRATHVLGYLQDFLFSPERARTTVRFLSGGERHRVLLAKLFAKPANVVVLDEPTNDLDAETMEMLESRLVEYQGTILVVSHDREFLNNVATSCLVFEDGSVREYFGGYDDWLRQRSDAEKLARPEKPSKQKTAKSSQTAQVSSTTASASGGNAMKKAPTRARRKLSFQEKKELAELPDKIHSLEIEIAKLHDLMADASFYQSAKENVAATTGRLKELDDQLSTAFARWEQLE